MMEIVIKISEDDYEKMKWTSVKNGAKEELDYMRELILGGTLLPKGHGDLKDSEKLKNAFIIWSMAVQGNFTNADIASIIYNSPTIIEADKESEV